MGVITRAHSILILLILVTGATWTVNGQSCLKYGPTVRLSGSLRAKIFPGPPNYESIKLGDEKERAIIVRLDSPVCVERSDDVDIGERNVRDVQLVVTEPSHWKIIEAGFRKRVVVDGSLFHAHTGHHRTKLLIQVKGIKRR